MPPDPEQPDRFLHFDDYSFDAIDHVLSFKGNRVKLSRRPAAILAYLIANRDKFVSRDELRREIWKGVHIDDGSIDKQVSLARKALGAEGALFIETLYGTGWRFVATPSLQPSPPLFDVPAAGSAVDAGGDGTVEEQRRSAALDPEIPRKRRVPELVDHRFLVAALLFLAVIVVGTALAIWGGLFHDAKVIQSTQLSWDGRPKSGRLLTDGKRIFFIEKREQTWQVVTIPVGGGDPTILDPSLSNVTLDGLSRDGTKLLLFFSGDAERKLWIYSIPSRTLRFVRTAVQAAALSPDGNRVATSSGNDLSLSNLAAGLESKIELPGHPMYIRWSPSGDTIRLALIPFPGSEVSSEWEMRVQDRILRPLPRFSEGRYTVGDGVWSSSGRYFFYELGHYLLDDIWVIRERHSIMDFQTSRSYRLTSGEPGSWNSPVSSQDDESILFAINHYVRPELVRFDPKLRSWRPTWGSAPVLELDYSKDCRWVAYTNFPDYSIWKARPDGSGRLRLTNGYKEARQPHWSPDGSQIAFMGQNPRGQWRVFRVSANGGPAEEMTIGDDWGVPTWSPDGQSLVFGERITSKPRSEMTIHMLDVKSKKITIMPGTRGLWSPRWSPDGRYILAVTSDAQALRCIALPGTKWQELVRLKSVDNATWSVNSQYINFNGIDENLHRCLYRVSVVNGRLEQIANLDNFDFPPPDAWFGVDSIGVPLAFRAARIDEIFKLKCRLP